jgi:hypothetical protein
MNFLLPPQAKSRTFSAEYIHVFVPVGFLLSFAVASESVTISSTSLAV